MLNQINKKSEEIRERLINFRREMHKRPELSGHEENTAAFVAGVLEANDIEVRRNVGGHGVTGVLKGAGEGPVIAFRADMDALPIQDRKETDYASQIPGIMHACGHDVHTAILMGTAIILAGMKEKLKGSLLFIFQPAEESIYGAEAMIKDGVLEDPKPDAIVALHCLPEMEVGKVGVKGGMMTAAADLVSITVKGKSGHASRPHQTVDAVLVSSMVINAIHHIISRRTNPLHPAVISIGTINGGRAENIVADHVEMKGTVRTLDSSLRKRMPALIEDVVRGITSTMSATYEFDYKFECPAVINDHRLNDFLKDCINNIVGKENVIELGEPMMGSEDFALFSARVPGVLFRLGTGNMEKGIDAPLHNPKFDVDEEAIIIGTRIMAHVAASYLSGKKELTA
ncbi:MAG: M20 family metallopeptidase [Deltaproteobacteria bacterium]|nr:M20 family metallopeptidase [Deltaproteobacteria bacterium]